jgi:hypothetical protein
MEIMEDHLSRVPFYSIYSRRQKRWLDPQLPLFSSAVQNKVYKNYYVSFCKRY